MTAPRKQPEGGKSARLTKAERRRQLLAHARHLFVNQGYPQTTTDQVAAAAGVSEKVLARHFASRAALLEGLLDQLRQAVADRWRTATEGVADPLGRLHAAAEVFLHAVRTQNAELRLVQRVLADGSDEAARGVLRGFLLETETFLARIIADGQQSGVFRRSLDPRVGAWELLRTGLGYSLTLSLALPLDEEPDSAARAIDCLLHCLLKTDV